MDPALEQLIDSTVTSAVTAALASLRTKHDNDIQSLREMLEKALPVKSSSPPSSPSLEHDDLPPNAQAPPAGDANDNSKATSLADSTSKTSQEKWNQADLGYFDPHLDTKAHGVGEVVSVGKDVYYRNVVLFVQRIQNLVTFKGAALVKANIATSLRGSALKWYTSELNEFDRDALNNDPGMKSWINTLSQGFKIPTSIALGLLTDKTYSLEVAQRRRPPAQYVRAIMRHGIGCNIKEVANQLSFAYRGLSPELRVFVTPPTQSTKAADFIRTLEEKQEVWFEMMTAGTASQQPYDQLRAAYTPARFPFRPPFVSQSDAFSRHQTQQAFRSGYSPQDTSLPQAPDSWKQPLVPQRQQPFIPQRQSALQPFRQAFQPQRQQYPSHHQQHQVTSASSATRDNAPSFGQPGLSTGRPDALSSNRVPPFPPSDPRSTALRQPYQSNPPHRGYQRSDKNGVHQIDDESSEDCPDGFYAAHEPENKEVHYSDKGFDEVFANFVGIETVCTRCSNSFSSKSQLHKHLKAGCIDGKPSAPASASNHPVSPIPIVKSKAAVPSLGSGLAFRGWTYATASVTLVPHLLPQGLDDWIPTQ